MFPDRDFNVKTERSKYKTELCRNFSETGWCPYE
jgi:hypothetical protein